MNNTRITASICAGLFLTLLAGCGGPESDPAATSDAVEVSACRDAIAALRVETQAARYTNPKDLTGLLAKLDMAVAKLNEGKLADAVQKLTDYQLKVQALIAQGKIAPSADGTVTPQMLVDGALGAIACIQPPVI